MKISTDRGTIFEVFNIGSIYGKCVFKFTNSYSITNFATRPFTLFTFADSVFLHLVVVRTAGADTGTVVCHHIVTGAFLHTGGTEAVFSIWVDVHLVRGGVVKHEWWAGVLARGFIPEFSADQVVTLPGPCAAGGTLVVAAVAGGPATAAP